ncbi:MAG: [LysW]-aminoadipate kinase, partial [Thermomicrobiales bacterium]
MLVIKLGGSAGINYEAFLDDLARVEEPVVFVHGGNAEFDRVSKLLGIAPRHVTSSTGQSSRFTDRETLETMLMVYAGKINKVLVEGLQRRGVNAVGLSALDGRIATGRRKPAIRVIENGKSKMLRGDYAGSIEQIDASLLRLLLGAGYLPVLTPPALSSDG